MTAEVLIRDALRPLIEPAIASAMAGQYRMADFVFPADGTGITVVFAPAALIPALTRFLAEHVGPMEVTGQVLIDPGGN